MTPSRGREIALVAPPCCVGHKAATPASVMVRMIRPCLQTALLAFPQGPPINGCLHQDRPFISIPSVRSLPARHSVAPCLPRYVPPPHKSNRTAHPRRRRTTGGTSLPTQSLSPPPACLSPNPPSPAHLRSPGGSPPEAPGCCRPHRQRHARVAGLRQVASTQGAVGAGARTRPLGTRRTPVPQQRQGQVGAALAVHGGAHLVGGGGGRGEGCAVEHGGAAGHLPTVGAGGVWAAGEGQQVREESQRTTGRGGDREVQWVGAGCGCMTGLGGSGWCHVVSDVLRAMGWRDPARYGAAPRQAAA